MKTNKFSTFIPHDTVNNESNHFASKVLQTGL